jgi:aspartokinase
MSDNRIPVSGIATTSFRISLLVPRNQIEKSVQLCHNRWLADTNIQRPD